MRESFPPSPFLGAVLARAIWIWGALHVVGAAYQIGSGMPVVNTHWTSLFATLWIWGFTAMGVHLLTNRRGESLILANLGFSKVLVAGLVLALCAVLEGCLEFAVAMLT